MKKARIAACAAAIGLGAGVVTGTGVAAADIATDPIDPPPANTTGPLGPTLDSAKRFLTDVATGLPGGNVLGPTVEGTVTTVQRIATNHSLTTARLV